ncbi:MAG: hypothetical protein KF760_34500 [Candidatus Eremiobacteraeota bacterium]|nr:hypothetical protein [Candidatus Eremiobacteraeota bacterium]MCW5868719.1 hypothetical protein [Candidatus Eremiobacteraeota bacterium]
MLALQDEQGLLFRSAGEIAALVPDGFGRWRVSLREGAVAHIPGERPAGPWVALGEAWVLPELLTREGDSWRDPAGFLYAYAPLQPSGWVEPALSSVVTLTSQGTGSVLHTMQGDVESPLTAVQKAREFPELVLLARGQYFNRARLRRIERDLTRHRLVMDDGSSLLVSHKNHFQTAKRLGLPHFFDLEPHSPGVWRDHKRDYPYDLINAQGERLKTDFRSARHLLANILWQILRRRKLGIPNHAYADYREIWYYAVKTTLYRAGYLTRSDFDWNPDDRGPSTPSFLLLQTLLAQMVGEDRLCTFREFGFKDKDKQEFRIGSRLPQVLVVCEKDSLGDKLEALSEQFGVSYVVLGGQPSLLATEFFSEKIRHLGPLTIIAYVDYDPAGWIIVRSYIEQLARYGVECPGGVHGYLVRPESFTAEELELHALPLEPESASEAGKIKLWMQECGGIGGKPMGITANRLDPVERVAVVLQGLLAQRVEDSIVPSWNEPSQSGWTSGAV